MATVEELYAMQENRIDKLEDRVYGLEKDSHPQGACHNLQELQAEVAAWKQDLAKCSVSKDEKITVLSGEVHAMKGSLDKLDKDMDKLTLAVRDIGSSLNTIAANTSDIKEVVEVYKNIKGAGWFVSHTGKILAMIVAVFAGWAYLSGVSIVVPK